MALKITGDHYSIEWDEEKCEWLGFVDMHTMSPGFKGQTRVQVGSSFQLEEVMTWVINYLDDMLTHHIKGDENVREIR